MKLYHQIILLFLCFPCFAQELPIIEEHTPIITEHDVTSKVIVTFFDTKAGKHKFLDEKHFHRLEGITVWVAPPGNYVVFGGKTPQIVEILSEGSPSPSPRPKPQPEPEPPIPDDDEEEYDEDDGERVVLSWILILEELNDRPNHPEQTAIATNKTFWDGLTDERGINFRLYDKDLPIARTYRKHFKDQPTLVFVNSDASHIMSFPLPESIEGVQELINNHTTR